MGDEITNRMLLDAIEANSRELKATIEVLETRVFLKIEENRHRVEKLEKENQELKSRVELLERAERKNNIIIFGLERKEESTVTVEEVVGLFKNLLDIDIVEADLSNFYTLGKNKKSPLKVEFNSYLKKSLILGNCKKLKGTKISVSNDLTPLQREEGKVLRRHLFLAKENKEENCYIKNNTLFVNNKAYTAADLQKSEEVFVVDEDLAPEQKANSAPGTPVANHPPGSGEEKEKLYNFLPKTKEPNPPKPEKTHETRSRLVSAKRTPVDKINTRKNSTTKA